MISDAGEDAVTSAHRLVAVGLVGSHFAFARKLILLQCSASRGCRRVWSLYASSSICIHHIDLQDIDTTIRAIGTRAHVLHSLTAFSSLCVVTSTIGCVYY